VEVLVPVAVIENYYRYPQFGVGVNVGRLKMKEAG
jgi:hypothetical protein